MQYLSVFPHIIFLFNKTITEFKGHFPSYCYYGFSTFSYKVWSFNIILVLEYQVLPLGCWFWLWATGFHATLWNQCLSLKILFRQSKPKTWPRPYILHSYNFFQIVVLRKSVPNTLTLPASGQANTWQMSQGIAWDLLARYHSTWSHSIVRLRKIEREGYYLNWSLLAYIRQVFFS